MTWGKYLLWTVWPFVSVVVLWGDIGTTFSLPPAVGSRDEYKLLPQIPTDSLLGHCRGSTEPGRGAFCRGDWQPMVCMSEMTCGLILLAAAHLSATSEIRELLKNTYDTHIQRQNQYAVSSQPMPYQKISGFTKLLSGEDSWEIWSFAFLL